MQNDVVINEEESCKNIKPENGSFTINCERGSLQEKVSYKARKVIIAIGNRGTPLKLNVKGEDLKIMTQPPPILAKHCPQCGNPRRAAQKFCNKCGEKFPVRMLPPVEDSKVKYRLTDPDEYVNKKCIVVGAGNSAIESAVDLAGLKRDGDKLTFTRNNEVTLVIRSDFKGDLKLGNKMNVYDCIDAGKIKVFFRTQIKEISETEVVLMDGKGTEKARLVNDYIFALIGGDRPTKFLESIGIKIG
jgi:thioredoxin reductase